MDQGIQQEYRPLAGKHLQVADDLNILPYMQAADILVTDTSSVTYEFLLLDRPIITYRAIARRDKGMNITRPEELAGAIHRALEKPGESASQRQNYLARLYPYRDRESSRWVVEAIEQILQNNPHRRLRPKPLNLVRRAKIRHMAAS